MKPPRSNRFLLAATVLTMTAWANAAPVTWNVTNGTWDTVTANWLPASPGTFANGDDATFNQAAGGTVTLAGTIAPGSTTVSAASGTYTFQGTGITSGSLIKTGAGDLILAGDSTNTFTGTISLSAGRIGLSKTNGAYAITGEFVGNNTSSPDVYTTVDNQFAPGSVMRFTGATTDHVRFELLGTTQTLAGIDNTGAAGRGVIQHREQVTAAAVGPLSNLILNVPTSSSYTYDGYLRGSGGILALTKNGNGTQVLSGGNISYTGGTIVNAGTLTFGGGNKSVSGGLILNGGTLNNNGTGTFATNGGVVLNGGVLNHNGTSYYTTDTGLNVAVDSVVNVNNSGVGNQLFFDGGVTGTGNLTINNTGSATTGVNFRNAPGSYSGDLTVNGGQIGISNGAGLVLANSDLTLTGAAVNLTAITHNTATNASIRSLTGDSASSAVLGAQTLTLGTNNGSGSFAGSITGTTGSLTKTGSGTQTLSGTVSYTGTTTVNGGILNLSGNFAPGGATTVSGGTLNLSGIVTPGGATTLNSGTLNLDYTADDYPKLTGVLTLAGGTLNMIGGSATEYPNSVVLNAGASRVIRTSGNSILDMGPITRNPGATINFSADYIASTFNALNNGILGTWATVGSGANTRFATTDGGYIIGLIGTNTTTVNDFVDEFENYDYSLSGGTDSQTDHRSANTVRYGGSGETVNLGNFNLSIKTLMNVGTGDLTVIRAGTTGSLVANDLFLNSANGGGIVVSAPITGTNLTTSGNITLSGANSYTGTTTISGGTVIAGSSTALGASAVSLNNSVLNLNGQPLVLGSLAGDALSTITNSGAAAVLTAGNSTSSTFEGIIQNGAGALELTKAGSGTLTLTGANNYSGVTTISAGTLRIGGAGGTLGSGNWVNNGTLGFARTDLGTYTVSNTITGTGNIAMISGNVTLTGPVTCNNLNINPGYGKTLTLTGSTPNSIGSVTASQDGTGTIVLAKDAGVNALSGTVYVGNGYASKVTVKLGNNEQIADSSVVYLGGYTAGYGGYSLIQLMGYNETIAGLADGGTDRPNDVKVQNGGATNSTLALAGDGTYSFSTNIQNGSTGTLGIMKSGSGFQTFTGGGFNYTGTTTVTGGTLKLVETTAFNSPLTNSATVEFNATSVTTTSSRTLAAVSGGGVYNKTGAGITRFNGTNQAITASGRFNVLAGTLQNDSNTVNWAGCTADMNVSTGAILDLYADAIHVDALTGGGIVQNSYGNTSGQSGPSAFIEKLVVGTGNNASAAVFSGVICNNATNAALGSGVGKGGVQLIKTGTGTQLLTGVNAYTGGTEVNGGLLVGTKSSSIGTNGGLKLNGGSFAYQPSVAGTLALGSGVLNLANGSVLGVAIGGTNGQSAITSTAAAVTTGSVTLNIAGISGAPAMSGSHALISAASGLSAASYAIGTVVNPTSFTLGALTVTDTSVSVAVNGVDPLPSVYWKGGFSAGNNVWALSDGSASSNWASDDTGTATPLVPGGTSIANFSATGATNQSAMTLGANMGVEGIVVNDNSAVTLNADGNILTVGSSGMLINDGAGAVTFGSDLALGEAQTWTNNSALPVGLTIAGALDTAGFGLNFGGSGYTVLSGPISGAGGLAKSDSGTLALGGTTPYAGTILVNGGTLKVTSATALNGSSVINVADAAGATFDITGFNTTVGSFVGGGSTGGSIQLGAATLTTGGLNSTDIFSGSIAGSGGALTKIGTGTLTLAGANSHTGATTVSRGVLNLNAPAPTVLGSLVMNGPDQTYVRPQQPDQFGPGVVANMTSASSAWNRFEFFGKSQTLAGINTGTSTSQGGGIFQNSEANGAAGAPATLTLNGAGTYLFNGHLRDCGTNNAATHPLSVIKSGTGTQTFLGSVIAFSGSLTINGGKLNGNRFGLNNNSRTITVNSTGTLEFTGGNVFGGHNTSNSPTLVINSGGTVTNAAPSTNNALRNVTLNGGTLTSTVGSNSVLDRHYETYGAWGLNGTVTSTGSSTITTSATSNGYVLLNSAGTDTTFDVTGGTLTVSAQLIDGDRGEFSFATNLIKTGAGTLALTVANTYTGTTAVNGGTLLLTGSVKGAASAGTTGTLAGNGTVIGAATIATTGIVSPGNGDVATLHFGSDLTLETGSVYQSTITGATTNDKVDVAGTMDASGTVKVTLSGHVPTLGQTFDLADAGSITGTPEFDFSDAPLTSGLTWDTSTFTTDGTIKVVVGSTFQDWINDHTFAAGADKTPTGDPDNDGISNAAEMVLGGNPATGMDSALLPTIEMVTDPVSVPAIPAGSYLLFTYRRTDLSVDAGVLATCEVDADLAGPWTTVTGTAPEVIQVDNNYPWTNPSATDTDRVRVYVPSGGANTRNFGRLNVKVP